MYVCACVTWIARANRVRRATRSAQRFCSAYVFFFCFCVFICVCVKLKIQHTSKRFRKTLPRHADMRGRYVNTLAFRWYYSKTPVHIQTYTYTYTYTNTYWNTFPTHSYPHLSYFQCALWILIAAVVINVLRTRLLCAHRRVASVCLLGSSDSEFAVTISQWIHDTCGRHCV